MVIKKPFVARGLIEMSWDPLNLFNLYRYSRAGPERDLNKTAFQLRWRAKQLAIPYHAGHMTQRLLRRIQPRLLPRVARPSSEKSLQLPVPPTTMLAFGFMERRVDTVLFRACFVRSIWEGRFLCRTGHVTVNGKRVRLGGYILEDGDIVQVKPDRAPLLRPELRYEEGASSENDGGDGQEKDAAKAEVVAAEEKEAASSDAAEASKQPTQKSESDILSSKDYGFHPVPYMAPWMFVPEYLEVNYNNLTVCFLRSPTVKEGRCEIPSPYDEMVHQRAFDFYSRRRNHLKQRLHN